MRLSSLALYVFLGLAVCSSSVWGYLALTRPMGAEAMRGLTERAGEAEGALAFQAETAASWISLASWAAVAATLAYKGVVRHLWSKSMFDYSIFRLMVRMRGASTRVRMLRSLERPMNRYQLARELGIDWKTVDRNIELLKSHGLILESQGGAGERFYTLSPYGQKLLDLLEQLSDEPRQG
ncbi:MAG: winged helix-turn-helix domain-containing protein [Candidatus Caldarchaeales archaeon]|jgi:DNA-binding transcriptional ArsR family regulator|nr:winged helix-turn-helix domain-containing protein [Candidatus Caldarchaeales archaeon]MDT7915271.1 winged helix-turn-helix domain-containing protein [Candidatus Caldarchaeales archaeon]